MTREITIEEIPEQYLRVLVNSARVHLKTTEKSYVFIRVPDDKHHFYILWCGLNDKQQLEEAYFYSNDIILAPFQSF